MWLSNYKYWCLQNRVLEYRENAREAKQMAKKTFKREKNYLHFIRLELKTNKQLAKPLAIYYKVLLCLYRWNIKGYLDVAKNWCNLQLLVEKEIKERLANKTYLKSLEEN